MRECGMTQKERVLQELTRSPDGLTAVELRDRTGLPENSLRTIIWEMRKDGWIEPIGGVRGRYKYGITQAGRRQAPTPNPDAIADRIGSLVTGDVGPSWLHTARPSPGDVRGHLVEFVRWLTEEKPELLSDKTPNVALRLEEAVVDFLYGDIDALKALLDRVTPREE